MYLVGADPLNKQEAPPFLSWKEMTQEEGIYRVVDSYSSLRFIVIGNSKETAVLVLDMQDKECLVASKDIWDNLKFVRTSEHLDMSCT